MAEEYISEGVNTYAAGSWSGSGFADGATLVHDKPTAAIVNSVDWSGLTTGIEYLKVLAAQFNNIGSANGPLKCDVDASSDAHLHYFASGGHMYYDADGGSSVCNNMSVGGGGHMHVLGGTVTNLVQDAGALTVNESAVVTNAYLHGGNSTFEYNATGPTIIYITAGRHVIRRPFTELIIAGGEVVIDVTTGSAALVKVYGGRVTHVAGAVPSVHGLNGVWDSSRLARPAVIGATAYVKGAMQVVGNALLTVTAASSTPGEYPGRPIMV